MRQNLPQQQGGLITNGGFVSWPGNFAIVGPNSYNGTTDINAALALNLNGSGAINIGNTATGRGALVDNTIGGSNTASGLYALAFNTVGSGNTAVGAYAGNPITGSNNTAVGGYAGNNVTTASNVIAIGTEAENVSNTCYIGNIFGVTSAGATAVYVNSVGKLGTVVSSRRFKDEIKPMDKASEAILALKPVTFRYKNEIDPSRSPQFGLVAEEVEKVNPDLVVRDGEGKVNTVRYEAVNAMLLNEFLKAHLRIEAQDKRIDQLTAQLNEQAALIQTVKVKVELTGRRHKQPLITSE